MSTELPESCECIGLCHRYGLTVQLSFSMSPPFIKPSHWLSINNKLTITHISSQSDWLYQYHHSPSSVSSSPTAVQQSVLISCHHCWANQPLGRSRWRIRCHSTTLLWRLRRRVQWQKRRRTGRQPSMPHWHRHIQSWRLQLKPWEPSTATVLNSWTT